ncbi:diguanylate cyclase/phosphodiesterase (GGDEF & EAL domains) with PAS/PAC sensor(s) [hydrothermal vent metagenome]|uniref:histidine kinase n=1 Tax=hydrothermal vent metagenome TaxID=652676 RepID=A0A3B1BMW7_9ZZZZ
MLLSMLAVQGVVFALAFGEINYKIQQDGENKVRFYTQQLKSIASELSTGLGLSTVADLYANYFADVHIKKLMLIDETGHVLVANHAAFEGRVISQILLPGLSMMAIEKALRGESTIIADNERKHITSYSPVRLGTEAGQLRKPRLGGLVLDYDYSYERSMVLASVLNQTGLEVGLMTLALLLLFVLIQYYAVRPLRSLMLASRLLAEGEFGARIEVRGRGEIAVLAREFNHMTARVEQALNAVQERERFLQTTLKSIGDAVIVTDPQARVVQLNPVAEELTGWHSDEVQGKTLSEVFPIFNVDTNATADDPVKRVIEEGVVVGLANHTVLRSRNGKEYQIADSAAPIKNEEGKILGVILVFRDVTQQYQTEEALRRSQKMDAIGQLSGGIAHDFNNRLGVIIGYLDFLKNYFPEDEKARRWVDTATNATLRCIDLTRQLLTFSRHQSGEKKVVNINEELNELETMISRSVTPEVEVLYFLAEDLWLTETDPGEFQDTILNLAINARDAMPDGGKLFIETSNKYLDADYAVRNPDVKAGYYVQLMLSDTGIGMNRETLEHIFEPFFTTKPKDKGTGLGMAMVYGFVKRYAGHIKIYSEPGVGTSIRLYLPRSTTCKPVIAVNDIHNDELPTGKETILIVDDEIDLLQLAEHYLKDLGYHTYLAENAAQALEILAQEKGIDLLFSDVVMPGGMNGYELAQQATQQQPDLKVLLSSGFTSKTLAHNGFARFAAHLLSKPYRKADLARRIRRVLDDESMS